MTDKILGKNVLVQFVGTTLPIVVNVLGANTDFIESTFLKTVLGDIDVPELITEFAAIDVANGIAPEFTPVTAIARLTVLS